LCNPVDNRQHLEGIIIMQKESNHSQDYDRKYGTDHNVKDKAALKEEFIDNKRKNADREDKKPTILPSDEGK
jgi:hypothetical protein